MFIQGITIFLCPVHDTTPGRRRHVPAGSASPGIVDGNFRNGKSGRPFFNIVSKVGNLAFLGNQERDYFLNQQKNNIVP